MAVGRNDNVIVNSLIAVAQALQNQHGQQNQNGRNDDEARGCGRF